MEMLKRLDNDKVSECFSKAKKLFDESGLTFVEVFVVVMMLDKWTDRCLNIIRFVEKKDKTT